MDQAKAEEAKKAKMNKIRKLLAFVGSVRLHQRSSCRVHSYVFCLFY